MRFLLLLVAVALLAVGCNELDRGEVVGKRHEGARTFVAIVPIYTGQTCVQVGTTRSCTSHFTYIPATIYDDEDWILDLRDGEKKGHAFVNQQTWESLSIGDYWDRETYGGGSKDPTARIG